MGSAYIRAAHVRYDPPPWILRDELALQLLSNRYVAAAEASMAVWTPDVFGAFRATFATRARLAEDVAVEGLEAGRRDYVILGAGADTFAWRHARASEFTVWEVDLPASQSWKRAALERAGLPELANVRFVPADLAVETLIGLGLPGQATWNWLGVTMYLEREATEATLRAIASMGASTTAVVEFLLTAEYCDDLGLAFRSQSIAIAEESGEPMIGFYSPDQIDVLLRGAGFSHVELLDAPTLNVRYVPAEVDIRVPNAVVFAVVSV